MHGLAVHASAELPFSGGVGPRRYLWALQAGFPEVQLACHTVPGTQGALAAHGLE